MGGKEGKSGARKGRNEVGKVLRGSGAEFWMHHGWRGGVLVGWILGQMLELRGAVSRGDIRC